jgi:hypothetical protein
MSGKYGAIQEIYGEIIPEDRSQQEIDVAESGGERD